CPSCCRTGTQTTPTCPLSLHDALPISQLGPCPARSPGRRSACTRPSLAPRVRQALRGTSRPGPPWPASPRLPPRAAAPRHRQPRSEEHTSELQSREKLVCRLLLEQQEA